MQTTTPQLKEAFPAIINRLDELYSKALYHPLTWAEQIEAQELRQRALMIQAELAQRERCSAALFG